MDITILNYCEVVIRLTVYPSFPLVTERDKQLPFYVTGIGCYYDQEHVRREKGLTTFQWLQSYSGEGKLMLEGDREYSVKPGMGMLLFPGDFHEYYAIREPWRVDWVTFDGAHVEKLLRGAEITESSLFTVTYPDHLLKKMRDLLQLSQMHDSLKAYSCSSSLYVILTDIIQRATHHQTETVSQQYARLLPVFEYIETHYAQGLTLQSMADLVSVSPEYLCQLFKRITGLRPFTYVNQIRVNKSKELLLGFHSLNLDNIAAACGFQTASYYCSTFKKFEGIAPGAFRKLYGAAK
jgi:AraC family transcriptional regulator of arabinose operon